ncbi:MAG: YafY family transcriptional regulator, partial [Chloroflexi bacterium]|nr:YafY family transcriptional regulator [Chloroflexota bacterium]
MKPTTHTTTRLITLIMLLQQQPNQKAAELADQLGVSIRTLHRYIDMLDEIGIPVYSERGPHGGFSLVRGYKMPPLVLTPEEAVAVYLGTSQIVEMWEVMYRDAALGALAKLQNVLPDDQLQEIAWARQALVVTHMHRADFTRFMPVLENLRQATRNSLQVAMIYHGRSHPQPTSRTVDPYALVHRWGWWYLIGHCHTRAAVRSFRVDRILDLSLLEHTFQRPDDFDLQEYLDSEPHEQRERFAVRLR